MEVISKLSMGVRLWLTTHFLLPALLMLGAPVKNALCLILLQILRLALIRLLFLLIQVYLVVLGEELDRIG
jgi:membrane-bound metal-dependent hydrolase YbcI (DUF457 family)